MVKNGVAVLATLDNKNVEARFVYDPLAKAGATPLLIDMSLRPHGIEGAGVSGADVAKAAGVSWNSMAEMDRAEAAKTMVAGGIAVLLDKCGSRIISGAIALGGANGTSMACDMMRALPPLFPKVMVSTMAGTPADVPEIDALAINTIRTLAMDAVQAAEPGDIIQVFPGDYIETVYIDKDNKLQSLRWENVSIVMRGRDISVGAVN